jgi:hypothetical protein
MTGSDIDRAERYSRSRSLLMAAMAAILVISTVIGFGMETATRPWIQHGMWGLMIGLWLVVLATGGGLALSRGVRNVMNDEVSLLNRSKALQAGFWAAALIGLCLYYISLDHAFGVRDAIRILLNGTIAVALMRYAWLELRD